MMFRAVIVFSAFFWVASASAQVPDKLDFGTATTQPSGTYVRLKVFEGGRAELALVEETPPATLPATNSETQAATQKVTTQPVAMPANLTSAKVTATPNGHLVAFDFASGEATCLQLSGGGVVEGSLVAQPKPGEESSMITLPRRITPPFSITVRANAWTEERIMLYPSNGLPALHIVHKAGNLGWLVASAIPGQAGTNIESKLPLTESNRRVLFNLPTKYRALPATNVTVSGLGQVELTSLQVEGRLAPNWNIAWDVQGAKVFVRTVQDGPGMRAGVLPGDELLAIDGRPISGWNDALPRLSNPRIGDAVTFTFRRAGKTAKVQMIAE